jgi:hypothetical protein
MLKLRFLGQRFEASLGTQPIDVTLRQDRAQPRGEAAAAIEVPEERPPIAIPDPVQLGIQCVGQLASTAGWIERLRRAEKYRTVLADEALPGLLVAGRAPACELEIGGV